MSAQAYLLLLWDTPVSLVGLAYLLLAAAMFVAPPLRGRLVLREARSGHYSDFLPDLAASALQHQRMDLGEWWAGLLGVCATAVSLWRTQHHLSVPGSVIAVVPHDW